MREITKLMIKKYALMKLKYDFMGYEFKQLNQLSFHHLIIPRRNNGPTIEQNGAILVQRTSHEYLHIIEYYDLDVFNAITSEILDQNIKGYIDWRNLKAIDDILRQFEKEYQDVRNAKGKPVIREEYKEKRLLMRKK